MSAPPVLCFVKNERAYFTHKPLAEQWGDDWNDAPYEHNAEAPYDDEEARIVKLTFEGAFAEPSDGYTNSPYSVEQINAGVVAWVRSAGSEKPNLAIMAGTPLPAFIEQIEAAGGVIYPRRVAAPGASERGPVGGTSAEAVAALLVHHINSPHHVAEMLRALLAERDAAVSREAKARAALADLAGRANAHMARLDT